LSGRTKKAAHKIAWAAAKRKKEGLKQKALARRRKRSNKR
jgi:hypothetical protein